MHNYVAAVTYKVEILWAKGQVSRKFRLFYDVSLSFHEKATYVLIFTLYVLTFY